MELNFNEQAKTGDAKSGAPAQNNGRFALALSGGGFRASFFHIGVLAALADLGILHKIEVISGVSGGSIIAAYYYLKVRELLKENWDRYRRVKLDNNEKDEKEIEKLEIEIRKDFRNMVTKLENSFLEKVQKNIRTRIFFNPLKNLKMALFSKFSRSDRISELYDRHFYDDQKIEMRDLKIPEKTSKYNPMEKNDSFVFKVPMLKLNSTTLNTGHYWIVEAKQMGEPLRKRPIELAVDKNMVLRRPSGWEKLTDKQSNFSLSDAVAASACVPGIFHPLAVSDMYDYCDFNGKSEMIRLQLVDGGVHDNLGLAAINELTRKIVDANGEEKEIDYCDNIIISDASGQLEDDPDPSTNIISVLARSNLIMMDRIREEELLRLDENKSKTFALMHLRKKLRRKEVRYLDRDKSPGGKVTPAHVYDEGPEDFGVPLVVQEYLSQIRTDLDSFTDVEAKSLMLDAYLMSIQEIEKRFKILNLGPDNTDISQIEDKIKKSGHHNSETDWGFKDVQQIFKELIDQEKEDYVPGEEKFETGKYLKHLKTAGKTTFKVFFLCPVAAFASLVGIYLIPIIALIWYFRDNLTDLIYPFLSRSIGDFIPGLIAAAIGFALGLISPLTRWLKRALPKGTFKFLIRALTSAGKWSRIWIHLFTRFLWPSLGWLFAFFHLLVFDSYFKDSGELDKFKKKR
jgi:NTE family protein